MLADLYLQDGRKSADPYMHYISQGLHITELDLLRRRLPSLTHLDLRDNLISHINAADSFAEVPLLTELLLDGNQLSHTVEDTAAPFKHLKHLELLGLAGNSIKSVGNQALLGGGEQSGRALLPLLEPPRRTGLPRPRPPRQGHRPPLHRRGGGRGGHRAPSSITSLATLSSSWLSLLASGAGRNTVVE